jgi:hypothetical protein
MTTIGNFGLALLAAGVFWGVSLSANAQTPDIFTKHGLPIPGAYFTHRESPKPAILAVSKSRQGVTEKKRTEAKTEKRLAQSVFVTNKALFR